MFEGLSLAPVAALRGARRPEGTQLWTLGLARLGLNGQPMSLLDEIKGRAGPEADTLRRFIEKHGARNALRHEDKQFVQHLKDEGHITVAEARTMFDTSRKYILPLLEYMDQQQITRRTGDERVLR